MMRTGTAEPWEDAAAKAAGDLLARAYCRTYGLDVSITRCGNNYGPCQHPEKVIPLFVTNLLDGQPVPLYGDGLNVRGWLHVDDHCRGIHLVLTRGRPGEAYNIGGGTELTNLELTELLLKSCGAGPEQVRRVPDRPGHDRRYSLDDSKLRALGYVPRVPFQSGLADTVSWYRDNQSWWRPLKPEGSAAAPNRTTRSEGAVLWEADSSQARASAAADAGGARGQERGLAWDRAHGRM